MKSKLIILLAILSFLWGCSSSKKEQSNPEYYVVEKIDNITFSENSIIVLKGMDNKQYILVTDKYGKKTNPPDFKNYDTLLLKKVIRVQLFKYDNKPKLEIRNNLTNKYYIEDLLFWENGVIKSDVYYSPNIHSIFYEL